MSAHPILALCLAILMLVCMPQSARTQQTAKVVELANSGWAAIEAQRYGEALRAFEAASDGLPNEPTVWLGRGLAEFMLGRDQDAEASLTQTLALDPGQTDASRLLGQLYYRTGRLPDALAAYEAALDRAPGERDLAATLDDWKREHDVQDRFRQSSGRHFRVRFEGRSDESLARQVVTILEGAYRDVGGVLRTYPSAPITVVLYTQTQFQDITQAPAWAGGLYDGQIRIPIRGALDRRAELERVLTHEYVHALVTNLGGRTVPAWVHEGLATVFEPGGLDRASQLLAATGSRPSLRDLHGSFSRLPAQSASVAYALSAVAADRVIDLRGPSGVVLLLEDLGRGVPFETAFHRRVGVWYDEFVRTARNLR